MVADYQPASTRMAGLFVINVFQDFVSLGRVLHTREGTNWFVED